MHSCYLHIVLILPYAQCLNVFVCLFAGATESLVKRATGEQTSPSFEATASNDLMAEALPSPTQRPQAAKQTLRGRRMNANAARRPQKKRPSRVKAKGGRRLKGRDEEESSSSSSEAVSGGGDEDEDEEDGDEESDSESARTSERMSGPSAQSESGDGDGPSEDAQSSSESTVTTDASSLAELASPARLEFLQRTHSLRALRFDLEPPHSAKLRVIKVFEYCIFNFNDTLVETARKNQPTSRTLPPLVTLEQVITHSLLNDYIIINIFIIYT